MGFLTLCRIVWEKLKALGLFLWRNKLVALIVIGLLVVAVPWLVSYLAFWRKGFRLQVQEKPVLTGKPEITIVKIERPMAGPDAASIPIIEDSVAVASKILERLK